MRYLYLIAGAVIALAGAFYVADSFIQVTTWIDEIGVIAGLVFVYLGTINILNYWYGSRARGLWVAAVAANLVMLGACWVIGANPSGPEWAIVGALLVAALLSLNPGSSRPA